MIVTTAGNPEGKDKKKIIMMIIKGPARGPNPTTSVPASSNRRQIAAIGTLCYTSIAGRREQIHNERGGDVF